MAPTKGITRVGFRPNLSIRVPVIIEETNWKRNKLQKSKVSLRSVRQLKGTCVKNTFLEPFIDLSENNVCMISTFAMNCVGHELGRKANTKRNMGIMGFHLKSPLAVSNVSGRPVFLKVRGQF